MTLENSLHIIKDELDKLLAEYSKLVAICPEGEKLEICRRI